MERLWRLVGRQDPAAADAWPRAVDRLQRAVQRYHQKVAYMPDRHLRGELRVIGEQLDTSLADVVAAGEREPARSGRDDVALKAVVRAATLCAHATEAAMMANDANWHREFDDVARCVDTVRTLVKAVRELADACESVWRR